MCPQPSGHRKRDGRYPSTRSGERRTTLKDISKYQDDLRHRRRDEKIRHLRDQRRKNAKPATITNAGERGLVGAIHRSSCVVHVGEERRICLPFPGLAVGDEVTLCRNRIGEIRERRSVLERRDPSHPERSRVLAANVDDVVIVTSAADPAFRPGLIDRVLLAVEQGGAKPLICLNKVELIPAPGDLERLEIYSRLGIPVVHTSCATGEGVDELGRLLKGRTCVFTGHSGVGKSSLVNRLCPGLGLATGEVSIKGRHTSSSSFLHEETDGTRIIDTPGIREFGLAPLAAAELAGHFQEFGDVAGRCRYGRCTHTHEPDCAVRSAGLPRYALYLRLATTL